MRADSASMQHPLAWRPIRKVHREVVVQGGDELRPAAIKPALTHGDDPLAVGLVSIGVLLDLLVSGRFDVPNLADAVPDAAVAPELPVLVVVVNDQEAGGREIDPVAVLQQVQGL